MSDKPNKQKVYPSSSGFMWGDLCFTKYKSACLRNILLASHGIREGEIDEKYKTIGALNEDLHEAVLKNSGADYRREYVVRHPIDGVDGVEFSGRVDFLILDASGVPVSVDELKGSDSKTTRNDAIRNGDVRPEHLGQIISYMISLNLTKGRMVYGYYEQPKGGGPYEKRDERAIEVTIDDHGRICLDAHPTQFTVGDQLRHRMLSAKVLSENLVWPVRPYNANVPFKSPCTYCPWHGACKKYDENLIDRTTEAFVKEANACLTELQEKKNE